MSLWDQFLDWLQQLKEFLLGFLRSKPTLTLDEEIPVEAATLNVQVRSHLNSALSRVCLRQIFKKMETGTFRVLGERDNHYTTET